MRRISSVTRLALALALLCPMAALAEPTPQQIKAASEEFDKGVKSAQASDFEGAAVHFENADREAPSDATLKAAIRARRDAKQPDRAATLAELALARHPDKEELTTFARSVILGVERSLAKVEVSCKPACELAIDKKIVHGEAATKRVLWLTAGKHVVAAGWGAKGASKEVSTDAGASSTLSFAPPEEPKPAAAPTEKPRAEPEPPPAERPTPAKSGKGGPGLFIGGAVVTGVLAAASVWSGLDTKNNPGPDKVREACVGKGDSCPEYRDGLAKQSRTNLLLGLTAGAAVVTGVIGVAFTDWGSGDKAGRIVPVAVIGDKGAAVGAAGRFLAAHTRHDDVATAKLLDRTEGAQRLDRYELIGELASGGMATVFLARLAGVGGFQRFVAIKRLHPHLSNEPDFVQMFLDEARLAASIHHPHVVPILEVGTSEAGYYVVMEYVEGDTLSRLVARGASAGQKLPPAIALRIGLDTLSGLHAAHDLCDDAGQPLGLVHRDVSPQNILVGVDGSARITDFGVARASSRLATTQSGTLKGKLAYMPPEQAKGGDLDRRADVFAMAIVLWEVLAGRRLFKGNSELETLNRLLFEPIPRLSSVMPEAPRSLDDVLAKALARDVDQRYATAAELADALERAADGALSVASVRDVAAYVKGVLGQEIEAQRAAVRAWLSAEPSQSAPSSSMVAMMAGGPSTARGMLGGPVSSTARRGAVSEASAARVLEAEKSEPVEEPTVNTTGRKSVSGPSPTPSGRVSAPPATPPATPAPRAVGARPGPPDAPVSSRIAQSIGETLASPVYDAPVGERPVRVDVPPSAPSSAYVNEYEAGLKRRRPVVLLALIALVGLGSAAVVTWKLLTAGAEPRPTTAAVATAAPVAPTSATAEPIVAPPPPSAAQPVAVDALPTAEKPAAAQPVAPGRPAARVDSPKPEPKPEAPKPEPKPEAPKPPPDDYKNPYR